MNRIKNWTKIENRNLTAAAGFQAAGVHCGLKKEKKDLALIYSEMDAAAAGVFTRNLVQAAPVKLCRSRLANPIKAIVVNSGNANACTGERGEKDAAEMAAAAAEALDIDSQQVLVCSTGVIGETMPIKKIKNGIKTAAAGLGRGLQPDAAAAEAILTTDTTIKQSACRCTIPGAEFHLAGIAKGSGMICPNMATMLAFLVTDAKIDRSLLQGLFVKAVDASFNLITVDGETSTNDTALILAGGASGIEIKEDGKLFHTFREMLNQVCSELARQIVEDGEGLTKLITLTITGAPEKSGARIMARTVLNSSLVKTAFYGEDANWGRIIAALGYAGVDFDPSRVDIFIGPYQVAADGCAVSFDEVKMKGILGKREISVLIDLKSGPVEITARGTDLSHEYININSSYRS
ncbi:MAG TPA: bifunctional glutamate N-acetyltransferase/amino-acid acetyltransferase ArgJ [Firmicutes bacterium]|nr:bifunctional glutamate N-acetyltransferase/amino-acid acetyltransferase ArgJ [Bacillota bacterium]